MTQLRSRLTSSVNYANRESTLATWQLDDKFDPQTNGNFRRTEATQVGDEWNDFSASKHNNPGTLSCINLSKQIHDPTAPSKLNQSTQFKNKQTKNFGKRETISKLNHIVS